MRAAALLLVTAVSGDAHAVPVADDLREAIADPNGPAVVHVSPGVHAGDLVIRRPLVLRGEPGAIIEGKGNGTVIDIEADDVVVEDVVVRHSGRRNTTEDAAIKAKGARVRISRADVEDSLFGIILHECHACALERVRIQGSGDDTELRGDGIKLWESHDSSVRDSVVDHSRDVVVWYTRRATLERNTVTHSRYGSHFMYAHDAVVRGSRFERNVVGVFVMYSARVTVERNVMAGAHGAAGVGLGFKDSDSVHASGNWLVANTTGTYLDNTPRVPQERVVFEGNVFALDDVAMRLHSSEEGLAIHGNDFRDDGTLIEIDGGGDALRVDVSGNHYTDYEGYDLDLDGVGDVPFEVKALSSDLRERHPALRFFQGTAAMGVVEAVARTMPIFASRKLLVDPKPAMHPLPVEVP